MRHLSALFISVCLLPLSPAVAAEPDAKATSSAQASPVTSASVSATATAGNAAAVAAKDEASENQIKRLRSLGYRPKTVNGATMYCRGEAMVGSRLEKQVCGTADDLDKASQVSKDSAGEVQRRALQGSPAGK
jgi:hypothetical protein